MTGSEIARSLWVKIDKAINFMLGIWDRSSLGFESHYNTNCVVKT